MPEITNKKSTSQELDEKILKRRAYQREYYKKRYHDNLEESRRKSREQARRWRKENPEKEAAIQARYNAKIAGFTYQEPSR